MADGPRATWITGIGIVSSLGEGTDAHWLALHEPPPPPNTETWAPYVTRPLVPLELDKQIPKKGDQRQMEHWQRTGTYAAGLALDSAGAKGNAELLSRMDMIVAAGGGERDEAVDAAILSGLQTAQNPGKFLNERLMSDLRPTLFLAQLSNLLAGNISLVHGVTGSSRTFLGEEAAGVDAVRVALARIKAGQSQIALVGGAYNSERGDFMYRFAMDRFPWKGGPKQIWERAAAGGGIELGSMGAFLVLEEMSHAIARGAKPLARLTAVESDRSRRAPGAVTTALDNLWQRIAPRVATTGAAMVSGASGAEPITSEERVFLDARNMAVRAIGSHVGLAFEPQFAMDIALAAIALHHGQLFPSFDPTGFERAMDGPLRQAVVTSVGHWRGEGLALVESVSEGGRDGATS
jgi:3-oxoacyl-[acyl-carrier-protein] synthase II